MRSVMRACIGSNRAPDGRYAEIDLPASPYRLLNAGADVNGFAPVTFEEMQENNYRHKAGWNPELCTMEADQ